MLVEQTETASVAHYHLNRRDFLKLCLAGGVALGLGAVWGFRIPDKKDEEVIPYPLPGWLETSCPDRPQFIEPNQGHKEYLRHMCLNNDLLKGIMSKTLNDLFNGQYQEPPKVGEVFRKHVEYAKEALDEASLADCLHVAFYTFAATYSPYFSPEEVKNEFGVQFNFTPSEDPTWWLVEKADNTPRVIPADEKLSNGTKRDLIYRCLGVDRMIHFTQHAFLTHMYLYGKNNFLQDASRIPNIVNWILDLLGGDNVVKAKNLSALGGFMWEIKEVIVMGEKVLDDNGRPIDSGLFDNTVQYDYAANNLGTDVAVSLFDKDKSDDELQEALDTVIARLNDSEINDRTYGENDQMPVLFP